MEAIFRNILINDWVFLVLILAILFLLIAKKYSGYKFTYFGKLLLTDTYLKTYRDDSLTKPFHILIVLFSIITFPLLLQITLIHTGFLNELTPFKYLKLTSIFFAFFIIKTLLQLILGIVTNKKEIVKSYLFRKQSYFSYLVFISLIPLLFLLFSPTTIAPSPYLFVFLWITLFCLAILLVLTNFKDELFKHPFYFILYLCAFEISPFISAFYIIK